MSRKRIEELCAAVESGSVSPGALAIQESYRPL